MSKAMGKRIHDMRKELNLSQEELGRELGVTRQTICKWENGEIKNINRSMIDIMAKFFGCKAEWLMNLDGSDPVTVTYSSPGKEDVVAIVDNTPIIGTSSLRAKLFKAALNVSPNNLSVAIELLEALNDNNTKLK